MSALYFALYLPVQELKLLRSIGVWCQQFTPFVGVEADITSGMLTETQNRRGLILDMSGMHRIVPDFFEVAKNIFTVLHARHIPLRIGIATTIGAAWACSRFGTNAITAFDETISLRQQLQSYPVAALRLTEYERKDFQELGLYTVEDLLTIPSKHLAQRFGFIALKRIDQALGRLEEPLRIVKTKQQFSISKLFEIPLTKHENLQTCFAKLLEQLIATLETRSLKASSFHIKLINEQKELITKNISLYLASKNNAHLSQVLTPYVESIRTDVGIIFVAITALHLQPIHKEQMAATDTVHGSYTHSLGELLNVYRHTLGETHIQKVRFHSSYIPERSFSYEPITKEQVHECFGTPRSIHLVKGRPSYLLSSPEPIEAIAMLPDKPPSWIRWREKALKTVEGIGPERIAAEWWIDGIRTANEYRDYFKVHTENGEVFWIFRQSIDLQWFVHGMWV